MLAPGLALGPTPCVHTQNLDKNRLQANRIKRY